MNLSDEIKNDLTRLKNDIVNSSTSTYHKRQNEIDLIDKYLLLILKLEKENKDLINTLMIRLKTECDLNDCDNCEDLSIDVHTSCLTKGGRKLIERITNKKWEDLVSE